MRQSLSNRDKELVILNDGETYDCDPFQDGQHWLRRGDFVLKILMLIGRSVKKK
jgi:hypothetical protein